MRLPIAILVRAEDVVAPDLVDNHVDGEAQIRNDPAVGADRAEFGRVVARDRGDHPEQATTLLTSTYAQTNRRITVLRKAEWSLDDEQEQTGAAPRGGGRMGPVRRRGKGRPDRGGTMRGMTDQTDNRLVVTVGGDLTA